MQEKNDKPTINSIPEYYLFRTYQRPGLLQDRLFTMRGETLQFIACGVPNPDNGPDFRNALIQIDQVRIRGDIEFHVEWRDWYRHGHDADRRYDQVVLHVLWKEPQAIPEKLADRFPHLILSRFLTLPPAQ